MKYATLLLATTFYLAANDGAAVHDSQTLVLPFQVSMEAGEPMDGLALALAVQNQVVGKQRLIPFTAYRKKLNEYGLSVVSSLSIATRLKLARDLNAERVVFGTLTAAGVRMMVYNGKTGVLSEKFIEKKSDLAGMVSLIGRHGALGVSDLSSGEFELFRVWASAYFADHATDARWVFEKLLEHHLLEWLFMQEYLALFGDPVYQVRDLGDMIYWRDLLLEKAHFHKAMAMSEMLMAERHNPRDFVVHARILMGLGRGEDACQFLSRAESFGFALGSMAPVRSACVSAAPASSKVEIRSN